MKRFPKLLVVCAGALAGAVALALLGINLYVQSSGAKHRIEKEFSRIVGAPVEIDRTTFTPWGGLTIQGITSRSDQKLPPLFAAKALKVHFELGSLFSDHIVIRKVAMIEPRIIVSQKNRKKQPSSPPKSTTAQTTPASDSVATPTPAVSAATATPASGTSTPQAAKPKAKPVTVNVQSVAFNQGSFRYKNRHGRSLAYLEEIEMRSQLKSPTEAQGTLKISRATLDRNLLVENVRSPFQLKNKTLTLGGVKADIAKGNLTGTFQLTTQSRRLAYFGNFSFQDVDLTTLLEEVGLPSDRATGKIEGTLQLNNPDGTRKSLSGQGAIYVRDGAVQQLELFKSVGQMLKIEELIHFELEDAHLKFTINRGMTHIDDLLLQSKNLRITALGPIDSNGELDLKARLYLQKKIRRRLPSIAKENMIRDPENPDFSYLDFTIGGTIEHPTTNIVDRLVGKKLEKKVQSVLKSLFGGDSKKDDK